MKAISLWQPWATLIALGHKQVETRHWPTNYRGPIAIHAAKRPLQEEERDILDMLGDWHGIRLEEEELPFGAIVATARLVVCERMTRPMILSTSDLEQDVGNWEPGRYAWLLEEIEALPEPVPARGAQGIWEWDGSTKTVEPAPLFAR
jgi:hypothetical protein